MSDTRRQRIEELFDRALDLEPGERAAFLDAATDDDALRAEVHSLLAAHERAEGLLERAVTPPDALLDAPLPEDRRIGPYRVLGVLGRGGMGVVYSAERADGQFRRRVALKVLKVDGDPALAARIVAERQILAALDHPNIAKLLDGGVSDDGRPYLVIEHVSGLPIDVYCERMRLSLRERLQLFITVARAVDHAHHNLIVHRDLKPSNILVTPAGEVKLLDFGIAKLLNPSLAGVDAPITRTDSRVLTPEYASPEQVRGEALTTSSDVYSLGVVLYELLTGRRPYELAGRSLQEMIGAVCDRDPDRPSSAVLHAPPAASEGADDPAVAPERWARRLRGDLDAIVMMALRKEPGRRYGSAEMLAQDIERHLDGRPVRARRGTKRYRFAKFVRRHRTASLAAAAIAVSLVSGALVATREARRAREARDRAEAALAQATEVTEFLLGMFEASDPAETTGDIVTAADLLRRGALRADELSGQPDVQARMLLTLAVANRSIGNLEEGRRLAERAAAVRANLHGTSSPEYADALLELGRLVRDLALYDSARTIIENAMHIYERATDSEDARLGIALGDLASAEIYLGNMPGAKELRSRAWQIHVAGLGPDDPQTMTSLMLYGTILRRTGARDSAILVLRDAVDRRRRLGVGHEEALAEDMLQLATTLVTDENDVPEAEQIFREALAIQRRVLGPTHVETVWPLGSLSDIAERRGDLAEAERLLLETVEVRRRAYGERHPNTAASLGSLSAFYARNGREREAETLRRRTIEILTETMGPEHPRTADHMGALAELLIHRGEHAEADSLLRSAIAARTAVQGGSHMDLYPLYERQALLFLRRGEHAAAERAIQAALSVMHEGVPDPYSPRLHQIAADVYEALGRTDEAQRHRAAVSGGS